REATESKLIGGINCSPESALDEFRFVKKRFHKEDGRSYYHIVQSFSPDDNLTPETAHEIGLKFAEYFPGFQVLVATHTNTHAVHNHLIMNSVSFENGKKFHQSRNEMLQAKEYSNQLCREYGLSVTETKTKNPRNARWKRDLIETASAPSAGQQRRKNSSSTCAITATMFSGKISTNISRSPRRRGGRCAITSSLTSGSSRITSRYISLWAAATAR
ncbi:MAG: relaxase/mobilization nuclease domain-containing protein, partial [Ruminococcus sp.]|nr:relaxase/mobilization nuclease domain-containing protein [Ruminococcus sp.]